MNPFKKNLLSACGLLLSLTGCYDKTSPHSILKSLAAAIEKSDLQAYGQSLDGQAASQYGNAQGMEVLRRKGLGQKRPLRLSREVLVSRTSEAAQTWRSVYRVTVSNDARSVADTQVSCSSKVQRQRTPGQCQN